MHVGQRRLRQPAAQVPGQHAVHPLAQAVEEVEGGMQQPAHIPFGGCQRAVEARIWRAISMCVVLLYYSFEVLVFGFDFNLFLF